MQQTNTQKQKYTPNIANKLYKLFLAVNATSWVMVIYGIKEEWTIASIPSWTFGILLLLIPVILSGISIRLASFFDKDNLTNCNTLNEATTSFLPTYLGYFFVGLGIGKIQPLIFVYLVILLFTYVAQTQYFNPIFLLFGYRFYNMETPEGTKVFIIAKKDIRNTQEAKFDNLRRINDTTYIAFKEENK